jgi:uncharacterized protein YciI
MKTFAVEYRFVPDILERRAAQRDAHFAHLEKTLSEGHLLAAGPFEDPYDGGLILVRFDSRGEAVAWSSQDPYMRAGLVVGLTVREYRIVMAEPALAGFVEAR